MPSIAIDQFSSSGRDYYRMLLPSTSGKRNEVINSVDDHNYHNSSTSVCNFRQPAILPLLRPLSTSSSSSTRYPSCLWWSAVVLVLVVTDCHRKLHRVDSVPPLPPSFHRRVSVRPCVCHSPPHVSLSFFFSDRPHIHNT